MLAQQRGIDARHRRHILGPLHAPLELQTSHAHLRHLAGIRREVRVLERQRIRVRLPVPAIAQTAGLRARAAVTAPPADHRGHLAHSRIAHTKRPVRKGLDLDRRALRDLADLLARQLPREHRPRHAEPRRLLHARERVQRHLCARVQRHIGDHRAQRLVNAPVLHQYRVHAVFARPPRRLGERGQLAVGHQRVERQVDLHPPQMAITHRRQKFLIAEVSGAAARVEAAKAHIHGVRAVLHGGDQRLASARGREQLRHYFLFCNLNSSRLSSLTSFFACAASSMYCLSWRRSASLASRSLKSS